MSDRNWDFFGNAQEVGVFCRSDFFADTTAFVISIVDFRTISFQ